MVEKVEGATMDCLNCGNELKCGWSKPSDTFKQKLQWQNKNGKAHYKFENGEYLCIDENGEVIEKASKVQEELQKEQELSKGKSLEHCTQAPIKERSYEQKLVDAISMVELLWCPALEKSKQIHSIFGMGKDSIYNKDVMILAQVFFKQMCESYLK